MQMKFPLLAALVGLLVAFSAHAQAESQSENVKAWKARLSAHIAGHRQFPSDALGQAGEAKVTFVIDRSGKLISQTLTASTGSRSLDAAALQIVGHAQPFPPPPSDLEDSSLTLTVPIVFDGRLFHVPPSGLVLSRSSPVLTEDGAMAAWRKAVTEHVWRNKMFPPNAIGQRGDAGVTFVIDRAGKLISNALVESTGIGALDTETLAMVERSQPFPKPPAEAKDDLQRVTILITFDGTRPMGGPGPWEDEAKVKAKLNSICRGC